MNMDNDPLPTSEQQLMALTPQVMRDYAEGRLNWSQIRRQLDVIDFGLVLRRLGEEGLSLPRAPSDRPTKARDWMRQILTNKNAAL